jgi:hypothetical protein
MQQGKNISLLIQIKLIFVIQINAGKGMTTSLVIKDYIKIIPFKDDNGNAGLGSINQGNTLKLITNINTIFMFSVLKKCALCKITTNDCARTMIMI